MAADDKKQHNQEQSVKTIRLATGGYPFPGGLGQQDVLTTEKKPLAGGYPSRIKNLELGLHPRGVSIDYDGMDGSSPRHYSVVICSTHVVGFEL